MTITHTRITAQGRTTVPATIRRKLGVGPGSTLGWYDDGDQIVVRRKGRFTSAEVHAALFPRPPKSRTLRALSGGLKSHAKTRL